MKKSYFVFKFILFFYSFALYANQEKEIFLGYKTNLFVQNSLCFYPSGKIECGQLIENTVFNINGTLIEFQAGKFLFFHESGNIKQGYLTNDTKINQMTFKKKTWLFFYENTMVRSGHLAKNTTIKHNEQEITLLNTSISFYPSGNLHTAYLKEDTQINGILCRSAELSFSSISFYDSGRIKEAFLAENTLFQNIGFKKNHWISFFESGKISGGTILYNIKIDQFYYQAGTWLSFYETGQVEIGYLAVDTKIGSSLLKKGKEILFNLDGTPAHSQIEF